MSTPQSTFLVGRFTFALAGAQELIIDLEPFNLEGFFSLQGTGAAGAPAHAGVIDVSYQVSNNGVDYVTPTGAANILDDLGDSDKMFASFSPPQCRYLKLIFTADAAIVADFWLSMS